MHRNGVSPIVAVILILMMSVTLAVGAFAWMNSIRGDVQNEVEGGATLQLDGVSCDQMTIAATIRNGGSDRARSATADLYLYTIDEDLMHAYTGINISGTGIREPGSRGTIGAITPTALTAQASYLIEVSFPDDDRTVRSLCLTEKNVLNRLPNPGFETDETGHFGGDASRTTSQAYEGSYSIIGGESGFTRWDPVWWVRDHTTGVFKAGNTYTLSMMAKSTHNTSVRYGFAGCGGFGKFNVEAGSDWHRETVTFDVPTNCGTPNGNGETKFQVRSTEPWDGKVYFDNTVFLAGGDWILP